MQIIPTKTVTVSFFGMGGTVFSGRTAQAIAVSLFLVGVAILAKLLSKPNLSITIG
jgi:hypothetical protein